jgi:hypothetical protein
MVYKGGWRCRHGWLAVDPSWSADLAAKLVPYDTQPAVVDLNRSGSRTMTVILPAAQLPRLVRQQQLSFRGYTHFDDVPGSDTAFRAAHGDWIDARLAARSGSTLRAEFDREWEAGWTIAKANHEVLFDPNVVTNFGGPSDFIIDGFPADHKLIEEPITASGYRQRIRRNKQRSEEGENLYQADIFVFEHAFEPDPNLNARAIRELARWVRRKTGRRAFVFHNYPNSHDEVLDING